MRVAICDDEKVFVDFIKNKICDYKAEIFAYTNGNDLINDNDNFDIAFLDIEMDEINGFQVAKKIHETNKKCILVFFTTHIEFAIRGYEFNAFRYILKQESQQIIDRQIMAVFKEYYRKNKSIQISYKGITSNVFLNDIIYIETFGRISTMHTIHTSYQWYEKLKSFEGNFGTYGFVRCHRSYLVNLDFVKSITIDKLILYNDKIIPIGRSYRKNTEKIYVNFKVSGEG